MFASSPLPTLRAAGPFRAARIDVHSPERSAVEAFIAQVYHARYGATLRSFMPTLLAYYDADGDVQAAVGVRLGAEGPLFLEQYLDVPAELALAARTLGPVRRDTLAEVGSFAALHSGSARVLIPHITCLLHDAGVRWVLFTATRKLRNAFARLQLQPQALAEASAARVRDLGDWGDYYATQPQVMFGDVAAGHGFLQRRVRSSVPAWDLRDGCLAVAS